MVYIIDRNGCASKPYILLGVLSKYIIASIQYVHCSICYVSVYIIGNIGDI